MATLTLTYDLHEEREEYELALNAVKMSASLHEIRNWLRTRWKHPPDDQPEALSTFIAEAYDMVCEECAQAGVL